jgi:hypothetical protein
MTTKMNANTISDPPKAYTKYPSLLLTISVAKDTIAIAKSMTMAVTYERMVICLGKLLEIVMRITPHPIVIIKTYTIV